MSERDTASDGSGPRRRQVLGLIGAGGLTALSATLVVSGGAFTAEDETDQEDENGDEVTRQDDEIPTLSVEWDTIYGDERPGAFSSVEVEDDAVTLAGVRLDDEEAGVGWIVRDASPDADTDASTYRSELNEDRQEIDEGFQIHDSIETVVPTDDGYLVVGWIHDLSPDSKAPWLYRIDDEGEVIWETQYARAGINSFRDVFHDGVRTDDGGFLLAGVTLGAEFVDTRHGDGWLVRMDPDGEIQWEETYNTDETEYTDWTDDERHDRFNRIIPADDGYLLLGTTTPEGTSDSVPSEPWAVFVDEEGQTQWQAFDQREHDDEEDRLRDTVIEDAAATSEGYLAVGTRGNYEYSRSFRSNVLTGDGWIAGLDDEGSIEWQATIEETSIRSIEAGTDEYFLVAGERDGAAWVGLIDLDGELVDEKQLHEVEGDVRTSARTADGRIVLAGHREDGDAPVGFAAQVAPILPNDS